MTTFRDDWELIIGELRSGFEKIDEREVNELIDAILGAEQVFFIGVGRVMLSLQTFAKRLVHMQIPSHCIGAINEPPITSRDLLIVGSGSGESVVPVAIAKVAKKHGARIALIGSNPQSTLRSLADLFVRVPVRTKLNLPGELETRQPMSNLFDQVLHIFGDAISAEIMRRKKLDSPSLWARHANLE